MVNPARRLELYFQSCRAPGIIWSILPGARNYMVNPARRLELYGQCNDWLARCQHTVTGLDNRFGLPLASQCGSTYLWLSMSVRPRGTLCIVLGREATKTPSQTLSPLSSSVLIHICSLPSSKIKQCRASHKEKSLTKRTKKRKEEREREEES